MEELMSDLATMERVKKVVQALWDKTARLISSPNDGCIACQIGEYWFYFIGEEDENLLPDEIRSQYDVFSIAKMILEAIEGLDDDEYNYYSSILKF